MRYIGELAEWIEEEVDGAKCYAEKYVEFKVKGNQWANKFAQMAEDELRHADYIHELAVQEINQIRTIYTPPAEMQEHWDKTHQKYVKKAAWVREMLSK